MELPLRGFFSHLVTGFQAPSLYIKRIQPSMFAKSV